MAKQRNIVIFTERYPYEAITEEVFVKPDVIALSKVFDKVYIIPLVKSGQLQKLPDLPNVIVDTTLACNKFQHSQLRKSILSFHPFVLYHSFRNLFEANTLKRWIKGHFYNINCITISHIVMRILNIYRLRNNNTILYSFWFSNTVSALTLLAGKNWKIITRAHGFSDLYEKTDNFISHHLRANVFKSLTAVYPVSISGSTYLKNKYPLYMDKIKTHILGSSKPLISNNKSSYLKSNQFTFISVSRVIPLKRIELNHLIICQLAKNNPNVSFKWIHIGDGDCLSNLKKDVDKTHLPNLSVELKGALPNKDIHRIYNTESIDLFMLLSSTEGLPIAICEAMSYGIPVIATNVGGNKEIVNESNGILVAQNFQMKDIIAKLERLLRDNNRLIAMRHAAYSTWNQSYNSDKLRAKFAKELYTYLS